MMDERRTARNYLQVKRIIMLLLVFMLQVPESLSSVKRLKLSNSRAGSSKFSLNPFKPLLNLVRDPLRASAQRHRPKFLPPPPGMFHPLPAPSRASTSMSGLPHQQHMRLMGAPSTRLVHPSSITILPPITSSSNSMVMSALMGDRSYYSRPSYSSSLASLPSDLHVKTLRLPTRSKRPSSSSLTDSVVRQLLDMPPSDNFPSVLVIEDSDMGSSSSVTASSDLFSDSLQQPKSQPTFFVAPSSLNSADISDTSSDLSLPSGGSGSSSGNNPDVFVIVSKNSKQRFFSDDKKTDSLSTASSKVKKYKISTSLDDFSNPSGRQVWIIKR